MVFFLIYCKYAKWLVFPHELERLTAKEIEENKPELSAVLGEILPLLKKTNNK